MNPVKFERDLPDSKEILENLMINTGLDLQIEHGPQSKDLPFNFKINSSKLKDEFICIMYYDSELTVVTAICKRNYMEGAIYHALSQMGGQHEHIVPDWTKLKYQDIDKKTRLLHRLSKLQERWESSIIYLFFALLSLILTYPFRKTYKIVLKILKSSSEKFTNEESGVKVII